MFTQKSENLIRQIPKTALRTNGRHTDDLVPFTKHVGITRNYVLIYENSSYAPRIENFKF